MWQFVIQYLKRHYAGRRKVTVKVSKITSRNVLGWCRRLKTGRYEIVVSKNLALRDQIGVLIHEYTHMLTWNRKRINKEDHEHDPKFREIGFTIWNDVGNEIQAALPSRCLVEENELKD